MDTKVALEMEDLRENFQQVSEFNLTKDFRFDSSFLMIDKFPM